MPRRHRKVIARDNRHSTANTHLPSIPEEALIDWLDDLDEDPFILALDRLQDPHNLGACLRTANAAGCHVVIGPRDRAVGITDTVRRIACGGADTLPFVRVTNLGRILDQFKDVGIRIVGTGDEESNSLFETDLTGPLCMAMGAEETGLRAKTASKCDALVAIPMCGSVDCLNVSVATGICLFEAVRQRIGH